MYVVLSQGMGYTKHNERASGNAARKEPKLQEVCVMYYSSGNYEAFAHPKKPEGVDNKSAYIIGSGLAALTAA